MKAKWVGIGVILVLAVFTAEAKAQPFGTALINQPTSGGGSITASGGYTVKCGYTVSTATLYAIPTATGLGSYSPAQLNPLGGNWGPLTIPNLNGTAANPTTYNVYVVLILSKGCNVDTICSQVLGVVVNLAGGAPPTPAGIVGWAPKDPTVAAGSVSVTNMGPYKITACGYAAKGCEIAGA